MAADLLSLQFVDSAGRKGTFSMYVKEDIPVTDAEFLDMIEKWVALSHAQLVTAKVSRDIDISGLVNPAPPVANTETYDNIADQVVMQGRREDGTGFNRITVPAPKESILEDGGIGNQADVDTADADVIAFLQAALDTNPALVQGEIWRAAANDQLNFDKGWRKGQRHA